MPDGSQREVGLARLAALAREGRIQPVAGEEFHLRPDCLPAFGLWTAVQTQWRHGFAGPTGLDYAGVRASPAYRRIPPQDRAEVFEDLCVMERAWLARRAELAEAQRSKQGMK